MTGAAPDAGHFFHGTKADLTTGDPIEAGRGSNYGAGTAASFVYLSASSTMRPGVPSWPPIPNRSYRSRSPLRGVGEVTDWQPHPPEVLQQMRDHLEELAAGHRAIND